MLFAPFLIELLFAPVHELRLTSSDAPAARGKEIGRHVSGWQTADQRCGHVSGVGEDSSADWFSLMPADARMRGDGVGAAVSRKFSP